MAAGSASVDTMLADAISKMDALTKRMDALETGEGHKNPIKGDAAKKSDDDDDDKKDDTSKKADAKKADDDDDDKKDDATAPKRKILDDDDDDDKKDDAFPVKKAKDDDGELEIKHEPAKKGDSKKTDAKKADAKKADAKKADAKKADDDDDKKDDDDDDKKDDDDDDDKKKDDAAKADSVSSLRRQIADQAATLRRLEAFMKPKSDDEHAAFADAQARADAVFNGFGQRAPRPLEGEALIDYRKRLATKLKSHSTMWKSVKFSTLPEEAFGIAEGQVYADALAAASNPVDLNPGELREVTKIDPQTGVRTIVFYGKESFVKQMGRPGRRVASFRTLASQ